MKPVYIHIDQEAATGRDDSRLWGYPCLPAETPLPEMPNHASIYVPSNASLAWGIDPAPRASEMRAMKFVGQINLRDLPADCAELPHEGLLSFFANVGYYGGQTSLRAVDTLIPGPEKCKVIYTPGAEVDKAVERTEYDDYEASRAVGIRLSDAEAPLPAPATMLFAPREWPEPCKGWVTLLKLDSMRLRGMEYNFYGSLCFLIEREALRRLDFSDVRAVIASGMVATVGLKLNGKGGRGCFARLNIVGDELRDAAPGKSLSILCGTLFDDVSMELAPTGDKVEVTGEFGKKVLRPTSENRMEIVRPRRDGTEAVMTIELMRFKEDVWTQLYLSGRGMTATIDRSCIEGNEGKTLYEVYTAPEGGKLPGLKEYVIQKVDDRGVVLSKTMFGKDCGAITLETERSSYDIDVWFKLTAGGVRYSRYNEATGKIESIEIPK